MSVWLTLKWVKCWLLSLIETNQFRTFHEFPSSLNSENINFLLFPCFRCRKQTIMGVFYFTHSVALVEDLPLEEHYGTPNEFYAAANQAYQQVSGTFLQTDHKMQWSNIIWLVDWIHLTWFFFTFFTQNAYNCWIAACLYVLTLVISGQQFYANSRTAA